MSGRSLLLEYAGAGIFSHIHVMVPHGKCNACSFLKKEIIVKYTRTWKRENSKTTQKRHANGRKLDATMKMLPQGRPNIRERVFLSPWAVVNDQRSG